MERSRDQYMEKLFYPKSVAVVGASSDVERERSHGWVGRLVSFDYAGDIYPINPRAPEVLGIKAYPSLKAVPKPIDHVIVSVASRMVPSVVEECIAANVRSVHIFSAGFAETGKEQGRKLYAELQEVIKRGKTRVIGPNCMGVYCPASRLTFDPRLSKESGPVSFVSQTGIGARRLIYYANKRHVRFSKVVSYGNAVDLDAADFLEYLAEDPETEYVICYNEGVKDFERFFSALSECTKKKPVVLLKGGLTESGARAVRYHTGSVGGSPEMWERIFRETGAIRVETLEECVEQLVALMHIPHKIGRNVAIVGRGGGPGVIATELCHRQGLLVPGLAPETVIELEKITPAEAGSAVMNPVEIGLGVEGLSEYFERGLRLLNADPHIDLVISHLDPEGYLHYGNLGNWSETLSTALVKIAHALPKPLVVVFTPALDQETFAPLTETISRCLEAGIPTFTSMEVAVKAVAKLAEYSGFLQR